MQLTPGAQIDELGAKLRISEQRRQQAEARLADRERQLGIARASIAAQHQQIADVQAELARLREAATEPTTLGVDPEQLAFEMDADPDSYPRAAARFCSVYSSAVRR